MKNQNKMTANQALDQFLAGMPDEERIPLVKKLQKELEVSANVFSAWRRGRTFIRPIYRREISRIVGKDVFAYVTE